VHAYGHDVADRWLLKDDTEANEVMESGNEFHSVIVLAAKDFWNWVKAQRGIRYDTIEEFNVDSKAEYLQPVWSRVWEIEWYQNEW